MQRGTLHTHAPSAPSARVVLRKQRIKLVFVGAVSYTHLDVYKRQTQNSAILHYLGDRFPEASLCGDGSAQSRAEVNRWLAFVNADVHPSFWPLFGLSLIHI